MSVAVRCSDQEFRDLRKHLTEMGVPHRYYMRKDPSQVTTFYLEVEPLTESVLETVRDYTKDKGFTAELEIDGKMYSLSEGDLRDLAKKAEAALKRGGLVRGYHY